MAGLVNGRPSDAASAGRNNDPVTMDGGQKSAVCSSPHLSGGANLKALRRPAGAADSYAVEIEPPRPEPAKQHE
jgi:hypothetical protein